MLDSSVVLESPAALDSSETVEVVLVVEEVSAAELVELLLPPEQAAMLATSARAIIATRTFFIVSFPFNKMRFAVAAKLVAKPHSAKGILTDSRYRV